jgi:hypothetical protein
MIVAKSESDRSGVLLRALGVDRSSFESFLEWALSEHLVSTLSRDATIRTEGFFARPDALKSFRDTLRVRTGRRWSQHDLEGLFERVKAEHTRHFRDPIPYEEYLKLLWQVPWECVQCHLGPPDVILHVDHIVPASRGGSSKRPNLQFLCAEHNLGKSNNREVSGPWLDLQ